VKHRDDLPNTVRIVENLFIEMPDGCKLAAKLWLPEDAEKNPVPAILEYIPYRKRDHCAGPDHETHAYYAGHGYAALRVDIRGSGDSEGALADEYLKLEQDDALAILDWIVAQSWCSGNVGMIGISWGGFNGLQVAARGPAALKAVITMCSTDDRYADDIHYVGGCMLADNMVWAANMFGRLALPPDPALVGENWKDMWLDRLNNTGHWVEPWLEHQTRDAFWKHGSVCEDFSTIKCPVYAVGGWADAYTNTVFRLLENLQVPTRGLVGPWAHNWPHHGAPGPAINFLGESLRWWDQWLKGTDTGIMDEPQLTTWMQDTMPPRSSYEERPGRWITEPTWPSPNVTSESFTLRPHALTRDDDGKPGEVLNLKSPEDTGFTSGAWFPHGHGPELALDQQLEEGGSLVFETPPLSEATELLGQPVARLKLSVDQPQAHLALCLSDVLPDGRTTRVSYGMLNLSHRDSHEQPEPLEPGKIYDITIPLNFCGQRFPKGHRIRLAISAAYWPAIWPSPDAVTLNLHTGTSTLDLPSRPHISDEADHDGFGDPESAMPLTITEVEPGDAQWTITRHADTGKTEYVRVHDGGISHRDDIALTYGGYGEERFSIVSNDPLSARAEVDWDRFVERGAWSVRVVTSTTLTSDHDHFHMTAELDAFEGDVRVLSKDWNYSVKRQDV
jgi:uncharacterized protein